MKRKALITFFAAVLAVIMVASLVACNNNAAPTAKERDLSKTAVYSMDLSGIDGYADKSVTNGTWAQTYDKLIEYIKKEANAEKRFALRKTNTALELMSSRLCMTVAPSVAKRRLPECRARCWRPRTTSTCMPSVSG